MRKSLGALIEESRTYAAETANRCRSAGWFGALFHAEVQEDIAEDAQRAQEAVISELDRAQDPKSDGGVMITPSEAARIRAKLDHRISEAATP